MVILKKLNIRKRTFNVILFTSVLLYIFSRFHVGGWLLLHVKFHEVVDDSLSYYFATKIKFYA